jgi:hypothetical protein
LILLHTHKRDIHYRYYLAFVSLLLRDLPYVLVLGPACSHFLRGELFDVLCFRISPCSKQDWNNAIVTSLGCPVERCRVQGILKEVSTICQDKRFKKRRRQAEEVKRAI